MTSEPSLLTSVLDRLAEAVATSGVPWLADEFGLGLRGSTVAAALALLALVALADGLLRWIVRRRIRRDAAAAAGASAEDRETLGWVDRGLRQAVPPLALLVWVHGLFLVVSVLLADVRLRGAPLPGTGALDWLRGAGTLVGLFWLLHRISRVVEGRLQALSARSASAWDTVLVPLAGTTVRRALPLVALILGMPTLAVSPATQAMLQHAVSVLLIGVVALVLVQLVQAAEALVLRQYRVDVADNLQARKVVTQVTVLRKAAIVIIGVFTLASMLMVFDSVRQFGTSILASAGIAGIIVGFAAQRSIATLVAGFQIALTQPIRLDDVVIVEGEWGRIEDITLTYVVVRIWDERRLVVPITYFIEQPFQNWTRTSAQLLASVFLHVDYRVPLGPLREEFERILQASSRWDGRVKVLQVTDATPHTLQVRALASAADAPTAWDLRCEVREKLVDFLQKHHPEALPRVRGELTEGAVKNAVPGARQG
jgi:small-conductance mechanosensitive channel